ncbi:MULTISPECIES: cation transporter [Saliphagus]|uniref:Cation transporter n=1 Tax=Saliphagus infecundisoli TaxID=1849069 RepID=A0ABD5QL82_9EURY|nr:MULTISPECIES: cation transporter [Saliphagus]
MTAEYELAADGLGCPRCEALIERELGGLAVVSAASADADAGRIRVHAAAGADGSIAGTVRALGYPVTGWRRRPG